VHKGHKGVSTFPVIAKILHRSTNEAISVFWIASHVLHLFLLAMTGVRLGPDGCPSGLMFLFSDTINDIAGYSTRLRRSLPWRPQLRPSIWLSTGLVDTKR